MISQVQLLMVSLWLWAGLASSTSASKIVRRRVAGGLHVGRASDHWDSGADANEMPVVTLRNLISHEQAADAPTYPHSKVGQSRGVVLAASGERKTLKTKRDGDMLNKKEPTAHLLPNQDMRKVKNTTKSADATSKAGRAEKTFTPHHKLDLHANKTRIKLGSRSKTRLDLADASAKDYSADPGRKLNLTGSYGVLKLLSKENLVRIVNSQMQSVAGLGFPSKGSRSRKRDLIDVNRGQEPLKMPRQDAAVTQQHAASDNQTTSPSAGLVTTQRLSVEQDDSLTVKPQNKVAGKLLGPDSKHLVRSPSAPSGEVGHVLGLGRATTRGQTEVPAKRSLPRRRLPEANDSPPAVLTMQPLGARGGSGATDPRRDPLMESDGAVQTESDAAQYLADEDSKAVNNSSGGGGSTGHVLRLRPAPEWSHDVDSKNDPGLVFEEAEEPHPQQEEQEHQEEEEEEEPNQSVRSRSRSRRSWIWNQFFVIEEYAGPEPVLIGRVSLFE